METEKLRELLGDRWSVLGPALLERKPRVVSTCSCCGIKRTLAEFRKLPPPTGEKDITDMRGIDDLEPSFYWFRNCSCKSTIVVELDRNQRVYEETA